MFSQPRRCLVTQYEPKADHDDSQKYINPAHINPILGISRQQRSISSFPIVADSYDQESGRNGMTGGVLYETSTMQDSQQDWMTGRIPRSAHDKQNFERQGSSNISPTESPASSYLMADALSAPYAMNYHAGQNMTPMAMQQHAGYYTAGEMEYPAAGPSRRRHTQPFPSQHLDDAQPLLTTASLRASYDTTIPQYYTVTSDPRRVERAEPTHKRKRVPVSPPMPGTPLATPQRHDQLASQSERSNKRLKIDSRLQHQLPTPPSTGYDTSVEMDNPPSISLEDTPQAPRRKGVVIMQDEEQGRKLGLIGAEAEDQDGEQDRDCHTSPRFAQIPALLTDDAGLASLATQDVLQTEVAWLETGRRSNSPPSSDAPQLRTPTFNHIAISEENDSPITKTTKMEKRLGLFKEDDNAVVLEPMVTTRIDIFGRVAVRKGFAARFFGLDPSMLVEETRNEADGWISAASSSRPLVKPDWPDHEAPWALAGLGRKEKKQREDDQRSYVLRRYLEMSSDGESDEEGASVASFNYGRGRGKTVQRLGALLRTPRSRAKAYDTTGSDAKLALMASIRHRAIRPLPAGQVACACGARTISGTAPMIECSSCRSWHHLQCNGIDDNAPLAPRWWCPPCHAQAMHMSTPGHTTPRVYTQSDERSSALRGHYSDIALAPSPVMFANPSFTQMASVARTPLNNRQLASPTSRQHRSRILSYGTDMWAYTEDGPPSSVAPSTPGPSHLERFSTPRLEDMPFDVTSTPSRGLDFGYGQPSLFGLTPIGGRPRVTSGMLVDTTPWGAKRTGPPVAPMSDIMPSRHDFLRDLNKGPQTELPASPSTRWPHQLLGAHNVSPSPFNHRRTLSGNKMSSMRSSSKSGLALGAMEEKDE